MKYTTTDELEHFRFEEVHIAEVQVVSGFFHMVLDNVTILPENSCNRDIREMRTNGLLLKIEEFSIDSLVREGYKVYNADGKLMQTCDDAELSQEEYVETIRSFADGTIYALKKDGAQYLFEIDAPDEATYTLRVTGAHDVETWDRFLNK